MVTERNSSKSVHFYLESTIDDNCAAVKMIGNHQSTYQYPHLAESSFLLHYGNIGDASSIFHHSPEY